MFIAKAIECLILLIIVPEILGLLVTRFMKDKSIFLNLLVGYFLEFGVLQIIAVPMIFLKLKYLSLVYTWFSLIIIMFIISLILNFKDIKAKITDFVKNFDFKKVFVKSNIIVFIAVFLIFVQLIASIILTHNDGDDAFYIGTAVTSIYNNNMYRVSPENGYYYGKMPARYMLSPFPMYIAIISSIVNTSPLIIAHTILQPIFILLTYCIYAIIAERLFEKDKKDVSLFLIFLSIVFIFGNVSRRTNFTVLFLRMWQGKAILANIILPSLWLAFSYCAKEKDKFVDWIFVFLIILSACLTSEMGLAVAPLALMMLAFVFSIKDKKIDYIWKSLICTIPCIVYLVIYILIK